MELTATEKLNFAIIRGGKAYAEWDRQHGMPSYLTIILYELLMRQRLTQKDLVNLSDLPKQSINKGIHLLLEQDYLELTIDPDNVLPNKTFIVIAVISFFSALVRKATLCPE